MCIVIQEIPHWIRSLLLKQCHTGAGQSDPCNGLFNSSVGLNWITFIEKGGAESRLSFTGVCVMCFYRGARVRAFFYWSPENMAPGFIGWCWDWISDGKVRARICVYMWVSISMNVIGVVSLVCVRVCVVQFKELWPGATSPFSLLAKVSPWQLSVTPRTHEHIYTYPYHHRPPPAVLMEGALSCNRGNLSTSRLQSCSPWSTL